jgi:hypothetical protein
MTGKHPKYIPFADSADAGLELPGFADLAAGLRFAPKEGRIMLGNQRMLLLHGDAVATLRRRRRPGARFVDPDRLRQRCT